MITPKTKFDCPSCFNSSGYTLFFGGDQTCKVCVGKGYIFKTKYNKIIKARNLKEKQL